MSSDQEWEKWGRQDPYFGVLMHSRFRLASLTDETKAEFFASGVEHVEAVLSTVQQHIDPAFAPRRVLDFGCGTGRLVIPFARIAARVVGVDVSPSMLEEARKNASRADLENVTLVLSDDELSALSGRFDLIHSYIVFQHIEPDRGKKLIAKLLALLEHGGVGVIHVVYAKTKHAHTLGVAPRTLRQCVPRPLRRLWRRIRRRRAPPDADPESQMNSYGLNQLFYLVQAMGVTTTHVEFTDHGGELGVALYFKKPTAR